MHSFHSSKWEFFKRQSYYFNLMARFPLASWSLDYHGIKLCYPSRFISGIYSKMHVFMNFPIFVLAPELVSCCLCGNVLRNRLTNSSFWSWQTIYKEIADISTIIWINMPFWLISLLPKTMIGELRCAWIDAFWHSQRATPIFIFVIAASYYADVMTTQAQSI